MTESRSQVPPEALDHIVDANKKVELMSSRQIKAMNAAHPAHDYNIEPSRQIRLYKGIWPQEKGEDDGKWRLLGEFYEPIKDAMCRAAQGFGGDLSYFEEGEVREIIKSSLGPDVLEADE